jgi:AmmeMemoRadiSam system protein B
LPFISHVFAGRTDLKILPIMVGDLSQGKSEYYAERLSTILKDERTLLVMSSDFCHWGDNFDYFFLRDKLDSD